MSVENVERVQVVEYSLLSLPFLKAPFRMCDAGRFQEGWKWGRMLVLNTLHIFEKTHLTRYANMGAIHVIYLDLPAFNEHEPFVHIWAPCE